jgi:hypothetical protein
MGEEERGGLPQSDYHLDESEVLVLRRQDGSFVAAFYTREVTSEVIVETAKEDYVRLAKAQVTGTSALPEGDARKGRSSANSDAERSRSNAASRAADAEDARVREDRRKAKKALRRRESVALPPRSPAKDGEVMTDGRPIGGAGSGLPSPPRERAEHIPERHHGRVRWYNPMLEDFEWREVPQTDERALEVLDGHPRYPACAEAYREWRGLGASIKAALIRAGEAARPNASTRRRTPP